jgi:hypothetical protein
VKYHGETSLNNEYTIKNGGQEYKTGLVWQVASARRGGMETAKEGEYGCCS